MSKRNRFVTPATVRLELSDGDWIEIKERLTYGEERKLANSALVATSANGFQVDLARAQLLRMEIWLTDWSFVDNNGKSVPLTPSAIQNLDPDTAEEIIAALDAYQEARADADPNDRIISESPSGKK
jgi:hypothetical protein